MAALGAAGSSALNAVQQSSPATAPTVVHSGGSSSSNAPQSPMPDLSHLTEEERRIIESVLMRQRLEEQQETEIVR